MIKNVKIPMDLIFKILNCIEGMPMVKFNPGKGRENIFRLWTKGYLSKNGLKLPYLYVNDDNRQYKIKNIDKILALNKSVGIYIIVEKIELYCELYPDGSINIKIENNNHNINNSIGGKYSPFNYSNFYETNKNTISLIKEIYKKDLSYFNYNYENFKSYEELKTNKIFIFKRLIKKKFFNYFLQKF